MAEMAAIRCGRISNASGTIAADRRPSFAGMISHARRGRPGHADQDRD